MPEAARAPRALLCIVLLLGPAGCVTSTVMSQPGFWDRCSAEQTCGPWVGGMLGSELLLYGIVAAVSSAAASSDEEEEAAPAAGSAQPIVSGEPVPAPRRRRRAGEPATPPPRPRPVLHTRPVRHSYPSWP